MTAVRAAWYDYARSVVGISAEHRHDCTAANGASGTPGLNPKIRWPGYLGSGYLSAPVRLLCVGQVHHAAELLRTLGNIQPLLLKVAATHSGQSLMAQITSEYERAMSEWGPWQKFRKIVDPLGIDVTGIAYTNVAKCWQTLTDRPDCRLPMRVCARMFDVSRLAKSINAQAIIIMSADTTLSYASVVAREVPMYSFPGRPSDKLLREISTQLRDRFLR